jgi:hypothetical protein
MVHRAEEAEKETLADPAVVSKMLQEVLPALDAKAKGQEPARAPSQEREPIPENPNRKQSAGEVIFNRVVYTGIGFGVNEASSLWITDQFIHGKPKWFLGGKPFSKEGFQAASKALAKVMKTTPDKAGNTILMATLLSGGTLLVLPMKWLEEHKLYWVKKANHFADWFRGEKLTPEAVKERDAEVEQVIACSPQQTWPSLLMGRTIAMFSSWATGTFLIGPERNKKIMDGSEAVITGAAKAVNLNGLANNETFKRYARLTGVETYSCAISSIVLEMVSKLCAKRGTEIHDPEICRIKHAKPEEAAPPPAAPAGNADDTDTKLLSQQVARTSPAAIKNALAPAAYADRIKAEKELSASQNHATAV